MPERIPQSATIRVPLQAYLAGTTTPAVGKTIAITLSKNGGAYANPSGGATNATQIGSGSYYVDLSTTDTGTAGPLFVLGTEGTIDNVYAHYDVVNAHNAGYDALPSTACTTNASLLTSGTGADQIHVDGAGNAYSNVNKWLAGTIPAVNVTGVPIVDASYLLGTIFSTPATAGIMDVNLKNISNAAVNVNSAQIGVNLINIKGTSSAGQAGSVGIDWAQVANPTHSVGLTFTSIGTVSVAGSVTAVVSANVMQWNGANVAAPNVAGVPVVDLGYILGTASAGAAGYVGPDWSAIHAPASTVGLSGTTIGTATTVTGGATASAVASVQTTCNTINVNTSSIPTTSQIASGVWRDTASGDFTVSGSIGQSLFTGFAPGNTLGGLLRNNAVASLSALVVAGATSLNSLAVASTTTLTGVVTASNAGNNIVGVTVAGTIQTLDSLAAHGDATWSTAVGFATPTNITAGTITTVGSVTAVGTGAITDASFTVPTLGTGLATGMLSMLLQLWRRFYYHSHYDSVAQTLQTFLADSVTVATTQVVTVTPTTQDTAKGT